MQNCHSTQTFIILIIMDYECSWNMLNSTPKDELVKCWLCWNFASKSDSINFQNRCTANGILFATFKLVMKLQRFCTHGNNQYFHNYFKSQSWTWYCSDLAHACKFHHKNMDIDHLLWRMIPAKPQHEYMYWFVLNLWSMSSFVNCNQMHAAKKFGISNL